MKPQRRSERCAIVNRTVSFNVDDPYQAQLLERSQQMTNFSAAVKRWLAGEAERETPSLFIVPAERSSLSHKQTSVETVEEFDPVSALF